MFNANATIRKTCLRHAKQTSAMRAHDRDQLTRSGGQSRRCMARVTSIQTALHVAGTDLTFIFIIVLSLYLNNTGFYVRGFTSA